jgi:hypothetical protein
VATVEGAAYSAGPLPTASFVLRAAAPEPLSETLTTTAEYHASLSHQQSLDMTVNRVDTIGLVDALPSAADAATWLSGSPRVVSGMGANSQVLAVGFVYERADDRMWGASLSLDLDRLALPAQQKWGLAFLGASLPSQSIDSLVVELSIDGHSILDEHYTDAAAAEAALADRLVVIDPALLGPNPVSTLVLELFFDGRTLSSEVRSEFALVTVPEPAALAYLILGLFTFALRRPTRASSALAVRHRR